MNTIEKQSAEKITLAIEFRGRMPIGASLASGTVSAIDTADNSDQTGTVLTGATATISGTQARFQVRAGTDQHVYQITLQVTLDTGDILEEDIEMAVSDL